MVIFSVLVAICLFIFLTILFYVLGHTFFLRCDSRIDHPVYLAFSIGIGVLFFAVITTIMVMADMPNHITQITLILSCSFSMLYSLASIKEISSKIWGIVCTCALFYSITSVYVNFPFGVIGSATGIQTMTLGRLQADNMIPYNFSRYIVEGIDPNSIEVVPLWRASERPPLMAIINSGFTIMLGLKENAPWMQTSSVSFAVFQSVGMFLNALSLLLVALVSYHYFGIAASYSTAILLGTNYFYFLNIFFTWPKFLMAFYLLLGFFVAQNRAFKIINRHLFSGIFLGAALISHEMCIFTILAYIAYLLFQFFSDRKNRASCFYQIMNMSIGIMLIYLPWVLYKLIYLDKSLKGLAYHFFCYTESSYKISFSDLYIKYKSTLTLENYFIRALSNLTYPFVIKDFNKFFSDPIVYFNLNQSEYFFRFITAFGLLSVIFFYLGMRKIVKSPDYKELNLYILMSIGTLVISSLTAGCSNSLVNHVWVYLAYLVYAIVCGLGISGSNFFLSILVGLHVGFNLIAAILFLFYQSGVNSLLHSSLSYRIVLLILLFIFIAHCLRKISFSSIDVK